MTFCFDGTRPTFIMRNVFAAPKDLYATLRAQVRQEEKRRKTGVYKKVHEDFEPLFDAVSPSAVVAQRSLNES